ncbi:MAG TPA: hypothetical protein GX742_04020 [Acholeplasmataceae bacterium]|nr:hypothetical protein [Acholeplasmataceae bacterium]
MLDRNVGKANGFGIRPPSLNQYKGVVINPRASLNPKTYIHELGHNRSLNHTFEKYNIPKNSTDNYMDYSGAGRTMFFKKQCEILNNNQIE